MRTQKEMQRSIKRREVEQEDEEESSSPGME